MTNGKLNTDKHSIPTNAEYIRALLQDAPPLTDEQVAFIRYQLAPVTAVTA